MLGKVTATLGRIAEALERGADRGPTEDGDARAAILALEARVAALEARPLAGADPDTVRRMGVAEARLETLEGQHRSLRGKVYRDPAFHEPKRDAERDVPLTPVPPRGVDWRGI